MILYSNAQLDWHTQDRVVTSPAARTMLTTILFNATPTRDKRYATFAAARVFVGYSCLLDPPRDVRVHVLTRWVREC